MEQNKKQSYQVNSSSTKRILTAEGWLRGMKRSKHEDKKK